MDTSSNCMIPAVLLTIMISVLSLLGFTVFLPGEAPDVKPNTQLVIITATPAAGAVQQAMAYQATINALQTEAADNRPVIVIVTATPTGQVAPGTTLVPTIPVELLPAVPTSQPTSTLSPTPEDGCPRYVVQAGDTLYAIALLHDVAIVDLLEANDLTEASILQIGQELVIPVAGCAQLATPTPAASPTASATPFDLNALPPTRTLAPTVVAAEVVIANVLNPGDALNEAVEIRNLGGVVNIQGWTLSDPDGNRYVFPEIRLNSGTRVLVYTRQGANTPAALYWGRSGAAWNSGETIALADSTGAVQATWTVGGAN